jgi:hypothetical protein
VELEGACESDEYACVPRQHKAVGTYHPPKSHSPILLIAFCLLWMRVCCRRWVTCVLRPALDACAFCVVCVVLLE